MATLPKISTLLILLFTITLFPITSVADIDQQCVQRGIGKLNKSEQYLCKADELLKGLICYRSYCKILNPICCQFTTKEADILREPSHSTQLYWSQWVSEEQPNHMTTDARGFVRSVQCRGDYCDQKSVQYVIHPDIRNTGQCYWSRDFSEEPPNRYQCGASEFVAGIRCQGSYCDNLSIYCCRGEMKTASKMTSMTMQKATPNLAPLMGQINQQQQPKTIISVDKPLAEVGGSQFVLNYIDNVQGNRFDANMQFSPDLSSARWIYGNQQGMWHPLRITATSGNNMRMQGEYTESGTRVREAYNINFSSDRRQVSGGASFVYTMGNGTVMQRHYEVNGVRQ